MYKRIEKASNVYEFDRHNFIRKSDEKFFDNFLLCKRVSKSEKYKNSKQQQTWISGQKAAILLR